MQLLSQDEFPFQIIIGGRNIFCIQVMDALYRSSAVSGDVRQFACGTLRGRNCLQIHIRNTSRGEIIDGWFRR
jgi:hypothetical protein